MNNETLRYYGDLLTKYREYILATKEDMDIDILKLQDEVKALADKDPEFEQLLCDVTMEYHVRGCNKSVCLDRLRDFSQGKLTEIDNISLVWIGELYQHSPGFRSLCDADEALRGALTYWLEEYQHRAVSDETFASYVLLLKLKWFYLGELGIEPPVEVDETERDLLVRLYHTDPEFRNKLDNHNVIVREAIASWLEEQQQRTSEDKKS